jgi:chaperonin GroES
MEDVAQETAAPVIAWECLHDKLIVRRDPPDKEWAPGLAVPDAHQKNQNTGTVLKTGQGRWVDGLQVPLTIQVGMRVIFSSLAGTELASNQPDILLLREDEILAYLP